MQPQKFVSKPKIFTFGNGYFNCSVINAITKIARIFDKFNLSNQFRFAVITLMNDNIFVSVCCSGCHYHIYLNSGF